MNLKRCVSSSAEGGVLLSVTALVIVDKYKFLTQLSISFFESEMGRGVWVRPRNKKR